jgi:hypothetical protein
MTCFLDFARDSVTHPQDDSKNRSVHLVGFIKVFKQHFKGLRHQPPKFWSLSNCATAVCSSNASTCLSPAL